MRRLNLLAASIAILLMSVSAAAPATHGRWVVTDLGIVGEARDINDRGQIIGVMGNQDRHAFLWQNGKLRDLGTLGGPRSWATGINERGQVVGTAYTSRTGKNADWVWRAFLWDKGKMRDLRTLGGPRSDAFALNDRGQVVGQSKVKSGDWHAFLWENGKMRDLGVLSGTEKFRGVELSTSSASDINDRGQVAGTSGFVISHAFLWQNGKMRDIGVLGGMLSGISGINNRAQVVGSRDTKVQDLPVIASPQHALMWQSGVMRNLGTLGGVSSYAEAINDRSQIVGQSETKAKGPDRKPISHAFVWEKGTMNDLGTVGGPRSAALGINERGQIVGWAKTVFGDKHAVLWTYKP